jgi:ppGpp synthetase/RelA/SpoT-type nucleotidyltranferase
MEISGDLDLESLSEWREQYLEQRYLYERLTAKTESLLKDLFEPLGIKCNIESRTKELDSFSGKISRPGKSYTNPLEELTDLSGIRIVLFSLSDVESVARLISREFEVDQTRSINKADALAEDRFGYLSQHFIVKVGQDRKHLAEWNSVAELCCEIQVRTVLQHAWAAVEHALVYKSQLDAPKAIRRRLSRLSALFELADEELDALILERQAQIAAYSSQIGDEASLQVTDIELNVDSLAAFLENSAEVDLYRRIVSDDRLSFAFVPFDVTFVLDTCRTLDYSSIEEIESDLKNNRSWVQAFAKAEYEKIISKMGLPDRHIQLSLNMLLAFLVGAIRSDVLTEDTMGVALKYNVAEGFLERAKVAKENASIPN